VAKKSKKTIESLANNGEDFEVCGLQREQSSSLLDFYQFALEKMEHIPWLKLEKMGWIEKGRNIPALSPLLETFLRGSSEKALFRKSNTADDLLVCFWLSRVELKAKEAFINSPEMYFVREAFTKDILHDISRLSTDVSSIRRLPEILAKYGIILVYEKAAPGTKSDGVVTKLDNGLPVIGMTLRYSRLDNFWFTLMHELSHVILHYDEINDPIIEDLDSNDQKLFEKQADKLSNNILIPRRDWNRCPPKYEKSNESIIAFAQKMNIHPAIVAGRLQKETAHFDRYRSIVDAVNIIDILEG
jgi:HTH-type transcriptional regulator/antitoxin HigA